MKKDEVVIVWKGNKLPCEDCEVIFKDKFDKEHKVGLTRLIRVFNNNIWQNQKSVKWMMKKNKTLDGYYFDGKNLYELWMDEDGNITQKKMK